MNKEIQVLYTIFQLELKPPFNLAKGYGFIYNKYSEAVGYCDKKDKYIFLGYDTEESLLNKIKQTFNVEKISDEDVYYIAKHLFFWLQDKLPVTIEKIKWNNHDTGKTISYTN